MRAAIEQVLAQKALAVVGVSRDGRGFGHTVCKELTQKGYQVRIVHPVAKELRGERCYRSLAEVADKVGAVVLVTPPEQTTELVREAHAAGLTRIWIQQGAESADAIAFCEQAGLSVVHHECILMFAEPTRGIHRLHRGLRRLFGRLPS